MVLFWTPSQNICYCWCHDEPDDGRNRHGPDLPCCYVCEDCGNTHLIVFGTRTSCPTIARDTGVFSHGGGI
jgi:hypothetical protein